MGHQRQEYVDDGDDYDNHHDIVMHQSRSGSMSETLHDEGVVTTHHSPANNHEKDDDHSNNSSSNNNEEEALKEVRRRQYSLSELVSCLNNSHHLATTTTTTTLPPELYRRVMDYRLAQQKRWQRYGSSPSKTWGIYGVYKHLSTVRTDLEWAEDAAWRRMHQQPYCSWSDFEAAQSRRNQRQLYVTYTLMAICTVMLLVEFGVNGWSVEPLSVNPLIGPSADTLIRLGALDTGKIVNDGQWFRLLTPVLLHAGLIHFALNMAAIFVFGGALEQEHGWSNALWLFVVPALGGNVLSALFLPQYISVGASGGIFGWIGACLADIAVHWNLICLQEYNDNDNNDNNNSGGGHPGHHAQIMQYAQGDHAAAAAAPSSAPNNNNVGRRTLWALLWILVEVAINIVFGLTPYIDNFIHLGGLMYGILCGWTVIEYAALNFLGYKAGLWMKLRTFSLRFVGLFASLIFIVISIAWLATMDVGNPESSTPSSSTTTTTTTSNPCPNCRYFNCIPFPSRKNPWWYCDDCSTDVSANLFKTETSSVSTTAAVNGTREDGNSTSTTAATTTTTTAYYTSLDLTCPNGEVVPGINVTALYISDKSVLVEALPDYCRNYCSDVYSH
ncbi:hypothetical protein ACA910_005419 [Epithemia clementina (nom. ined.)]